MTRQTDLFMLLLNVQQNQHFAINMGKIIFFCALYRQLYGIIIDMSNHYCVYCRSHTSNISLLLYVEMIRI